MATTAFHAVLRPGQLARYLYVAAVCSVSPLSASLSAMKKLTSDLINIPGFEKLQPSDATSEDTAVGDRFANNDHTSIFRILFTT